MDRDKELKKLGARIREMRINKNMTQAQLASACALDRNYVGMVERGERNPTYISLCAIAKGLSTEVSELV